jgi:hypothetical protein
MGPSALVTRRPECLIRDYRREQSALWRHSGRLAMAVRYQHGSEAEVGSCQIDAIEAGMAAGRGRRAVGDGPFVALQFESRSALDYAPRLGSPLENRRRLNRQPGGTPGLEPAGEIGRTRESQLLKSRAGQARLVPLVADEDDFQIKGVP